MNTKRTITTIAGLSLALCVPLAAAVPASASVLPAVDTVASSHLATVADETSVQAPRVTRLDGQLPDTTADWRTGEDQDMWMVFDGHHQRVASTVIGTSGTLHVSGFDGERESHVVDVPVTAGRTADVPLTLPDGQAFLEYTFVVENADGERSEPYRFVLWER